MKLFPTAVLLAIAAVSWNTDAAPPELSDLAFLPGDDGVGPAAGFQDGADIAAGGSGFLTVWVDGRTILPRPTGIAKMGQAGLGTLLDIYGTRLDAQGSPIEATAFVIGHAKRDQTTPRVAWNGTDWLVVWMTVRENDQYYTDIHAARVSAQGVVLDDPPIVVDTAKTSDGLRNPCVSSDGTQWAVAWIDLDEQAGVFIIDGARIGPDGTVIDIGGKSLRHDVYNSAPFNPGLAFAGDEYLLTWQEDGNPQVVVRGQRLMSDLTKIGGPFTIGNSSYTGSTYPTVATDGTDFYVSWLDDTFAYGRVFGARVTHAGTVLDPGGGVIARDARVFTRQDVAWDGEHWVVTYTRDNGGGGPFDFDIRALRIDTQGTVLDPEGQVVHTPSDQIQYNSAIAASVEGTRIVFTDNRLGGLAPEDIRTSSLSRAGQVGSESVISLAAPRQSQVRLAPGDGQYLAVYLSDLSGDTHIVARRLNAAGHAIDAGPIVVASGSANLTNPAAAWNGSVFMVTWEDRSTPRGTILARRLGPGGLFLDPTPVTIMPGNEPDVAALGDVFLIVGTDQLQHIRNVVGVRVDGPSGQPLDQAPRMIGGSYALSPRAGVLGNRWIVVWDANVTHDNFDSAAVGVLVNPDGSNFKGLNFSLDSSRHRGRPAVASSDQGAMVVWQEPEPYEDILGRLVTPDGGLPGQPFAVSTTLDDQLIPSIAFDGSEFLTVWHDERNDPQLAQPEGDIFGARTAPDGTLIDPDGFAVLTSDLPEDYPAAGSLGQGSIVLAASVLRPQPPFSAPRIGVRVTNPVSCYADFTGDGSLDLFDFLGYVNAFNAGDAGADCDQNGELDLFDFLCFVNAFNAGC